MSFLSEPVKLVVFYSVDICIKIIIVFIYKNYTAVSALLATFLDVFLLSCRGMAD